MADQISPVGLAQEAFMGRQPILDRERRITAYELLFRGSADAQSAVIDDIRAASSSVIFNAFTTLGADYVLGDRLGFFNVTGELLQDGLVDVLPKERVVIELLESVEVTPELTARCRELRAAGFRLALDDFLSDDPRASLIGEVDFVKVDLPAVAPNQLEPLVRKLRTGPAQLLAEKVETESEFSRCYDLGFDLFQGYFFARPTTLSARALDPGHAALVTLIAKLESDVDVDEIVDLFSRHANLSVSLLRLVNSSAMGRPVAFGRIADAVNYLGRQQLQRWVTLALYGGGPQGMLSPLLPTAARRGRLMELAMSEAFEGAPRSEGERAFLVGMLSLLDVLLGQPLEVLVPELNLEPELAAALLKREGTAGTLLDLAEGIERLDIDRIHAVSSTLGITVDRLQEMDHAAYGWVHDLNREAQ